ncbi:SipW-dependent-type signal peptide-containing protein [Agrococcus jejuensis]|uniref:SipW-dependent-type signal peptide-containing protein n=1 Tax=Agrococcus jejuensis TaxID=399736 RepID=UPI0011A095F2|nr:SipW-dependent-type signal peptide-containing protein [Agrococcus jejuensis]
MSATPTEALASPDRGARRRKIRAILAGGLVLGVGAAITLAAWSDSEYATGSFTAGTFNLEGSTDGTAYTDHASAPGAALTFTAPAANLSPGQSTATPFWVRLAANTTTGATLDLTEVTSTGANAANLTFHAYALAANGSCTTSTTGTDLATGGPLTTGTVAGATTPLVNGTPVTAAGAATQVCLVVAAGPGLVQGGSVTSTWHFVATSS